MVNPLKLTFKKTMQLSKNRIGNVVGRNVVSGTIDRRFDQATDYDICKSRFCDTLSWFRPNQYLLFLLNAACLAQNRDLQMS
jgi:hypothetical protein